MDSNHRDDPPASPRQFLTTHWSAVLAAASTNSQLARSALSELCRDYWYPLYGFVRSQGYGPHDAEDLTQEFFATLLEKNYLADVRREKGKFRSFLLLALQRFLANQRDRARARKRGGGLTVVSIDQQDAESRYSLEPAHDVTPETLFEQRWAQALLDRVFDRLSQEYAAAGKAGLFQELRSGLGGERGDVPYAQIGQRLNLSEAAVKMTVHRLRARYRALLREEIGRTVTEPAEIEEEIRHLFQAFSS